MVYVMSDIHGDNKKFRSVMQKINLRADDTLYILGDVVDRNPDGIKILQKIMKMNNAKMILGNHEHMMLSTLEMSGFSGERRYDFDWRYSTKQWYRNGGMCTHSAFLDLNKSEQNRIIEYIRDLPINIDIEVNGHRYKLVHASPMTLYRSFLNGRGKWDNPYSDRIEFAIWERWSGFQPRNYTLIFGHTINYHYHHTDPISIYKNRHVIGMDCGSGISSYYRPRGRLGCLRLDDMEEFYSD